MYYGPIGADAVKSLRLALNQTQEGIAMAFGVSRATWIRWETKGASAQVAHHMACYALPENCGQLIIVRLAARPNDPYTCDIMGFYPAIHDHETLRARMVADASK